MHYDSPFHYNDHDCLTTCEKKQTCIPIKSVLKQHQEFLKEFKTILNDLEIYQRRQFVQEPFFFLPSMVGVWRTSLYNCMLYSKTFKKKKILFISDQIGRDIMMILFFFLALVLVFTYSCVHVCFIFGLIFSQLCQMDDVRLFTYMIPDVYTHVSFQLQGF